MSTNDADIFHRFMVSLGKRRMDRTIHAGKPAESTYNGMESLARNVIASARQNVDGLPEIHFDFIYDAEINAIAFRSEDRYFIGVTTGAIYMIQLALGRMLSHPELFPKIGDPTEESDKPEVLKHYRPNAQRMAEAGSWPSRPRNVVRRAYMDHLLGRAVLFLVAHEIAHITRGHVDYMGSQAGIPIIAEMASASVDRVIERQTIEADADRRAVMFGLVSIANTVGNPIAARPPWLVSPPTFDDLVFDWSFVVNTIFRLFGDIRFHPSDLTTTVYPPLPLRRVMAMDVAKVILSSNPTPMTKERIIEVLRSGLTYCEEAFAVILGEPVSTDGIAEADTPAGREHHRRLIKYWVDELRDRIGPFAYERDRDEEGAKPGRTTE
jgi:hypothetical protein